MIGEIDVCINVCMCACVSGYWLCLVRPCARVRRFRCGLCGETFCLTLDHTHDTRQDSLGYGRDDEDVTVDAKVEALLPVNVC